MRKILSILPVLLLFFAVSCGIEGVVSNEIMKSGDSAVTGDSAVAKKSDSLPHEVRKGKKADYPYPPDVNFGTLYIGNPDSFKIFWRNNGAEFTKLDGNRSVASFYNNKQTEWAAVYLTKNKANRETPYGIVVQKAKQIGAPNIPCKPLIISKTNFISGHQVYIGMPVDFLMGIYVDQALTQWEKGDTLYLQYRPELKDASHFKTFGWQHYTATYKFVDDRLRRIEYFVDAAEIESR